VGEFSLWGAGFGGTVLITTQFGGCMLGVQKSIVSRECRFQIYRFFLFLFSFYFFFCKLVILSRFVRRGGFP